MLTQNTRNDENNWNNENYFFLNETSLWTSHMKRIKEGELGVTAWRLSHLVSSLSTALIWLLWIIQNLFYIHGSNMIETSAECTYACLYSGNPFKSQLQISNFDAMNFEIGEGWPPCMLIILPK